MYFVDFWKNNKYDILPKILAVPVAVLMELFFVLCVILLGQIKYSSRSIEALLKIRMF